MRLKLFSIDKRITWTEIQVFEKFSTVAKENNIESYCIWVDKDEKSYFTKAFMMNLNDVEHEKIQNKDTDYDFLCKVIAVYDFETKELEVLKNE